MKLRIMKKCDCSEECEGKSYFIFKSKLFQIRLFNDYGTKFLYIHFGEKYWKWDW
jgi:hypothetical protein